MAIMLGVARLLSQTAVRAALRGRVRLLFQPAEEAASTGGGARRMIAGGCLAGVGRVFGLHLWNFQDCGQVGVMVGPCTAFSDRFVISVLGRGGHGAMPHNTVDALLVASHLVVALQTLVSRAQDPLHSRVVSVGRLRSGEAPNAIASTAVLEGTVRNFRVEDKARGAARRRVRTARDGTVRLKGCVLTSVVTSDCSYERVGVGRTAMRTQVGSTGYTAH